MRFARRVRVALVLAMLCLTAAAVTACGQGAAPGGKNPQAVFDAAVSRADAALQSGDAEAAYNLYTEALKTEGTTDTSGAVAAQQQSAKQLMLSRSILAKSEPSLGALSSYVLVLQYSAKESTEAATARNGLADSLKEYPKEMRTEVAALRKSIRAGRSFTMPLTVSLVDGLADGWQAEVAQAPGSAGTHAAAAAKDMSAATAAVNRAFDRTYADDALRDLSAADKSLDAADRELKALRSGD